jgi:hypothetical protein
MKQQDIEKKIETTLNSLDHVSRVGPGPFFYTRVMARLNKTGLTTWEKVTAFISQPAVAFAVICIVVSLNTVAIFQTETSPIITEQNGFTTIDEAELDVFAFYNEENNNSETP